MKKLSPEHRDKVIRTLKQGKGIGNGNWKGGKIISQEGYILLRLPDHPNAQSNGYYLQHRLVMEQKIGRYLTKEEVVHHINGEKIDNRPENLFLTTHHWHGTHHRATPEARKMQSETMKRIRKEKFWSTKSIKVDRKT